MEETITTANAMSSSLLGRAVYCVCFPERDGLDTLQGEFTAARKKFFSNGKKAVRVGKSEIIKGFDGKLRGKLTKRDLYWKKSAGKAAGSKSIVLEEAFDQKGGHVLVNRDFRNILVSRVFFGAEQAWLKSEYYEPWDSRNARVILKPVEASDAVERFDWDSEKKRYRSTLLYPVPYLAGTAEQSILNVRFGEPRLILSTEDGEFCYCPHGEVQARKKAMEDLHKGSIVLMPAWEIKDGTISGSEEEEDGNITFTSLEEYARVAPPEKQTDLAKKAAEEKPVQQDIFSSSRPMPSAQTEEFTPLLESEDEPNDQEILEAARRASTEQEQEGGAQKPAAAIAPGGGYVGSIRNGKVTGRGRTDQQNGLTAYDGEYLDGKRQGFGSYYYKNGNLCYAGFWKDDKKDGLGVSFRNSDHALHIANWKDGKPQGFVSLFDPEGNLRYSGRIEDGKKQGAGVSIGKEDGSVFVGKWLDGQYTGVGSAFDKDGNLLYYGCWKDGKRCGHGTEFDQNGGIVFDGEWKDDQYHNGILYRKLNQDAPDDPDAAGPTWDL